MRNLLLITLLLAACSAAEPPIDDTEGWVSIGRAGAVREYTTPSGIHCVLYDAYYGNGIDCDWQAR